MSVRRRCALCNKRTAGFFCDCEEPEVLMCSRCMGKHYVHWPGKMHRCLPIAALEQHQSPGFYERFNSRSRTFQQKLTSLRRSLASIDQCSEEFNQKVNQLLQYIQDFQAFTIQKLADLKTDLSARLDRVSKQVEKSLYADPNPSEDPIAQVLRSCQETEEELSLFSYQLNNSEVRESVEQMLHYDIMDGKEPVGEYLLAGISENTLLLYNSNGGIEKQFNLEVDFDSYSTVIYLNKEVYFLGGYSREVFSMNIDTMDITELPQKGNRNLSFGIHAQNSGIYLFGGKYETWVEEEDCEYVKSEDSTKFSLGSQEWEKLPKMAEKRSDFAPAKYRNSLYLASGSTPLEVFDLLSETYQQLSLSNPTCQGPNIAFVAYGELVILDLFQHIQYRLDIANNRSSFRRLIYTSGEINGSATGGILQLKEKVLWVATGQGTLWQFSMQESSMGPAYTTTSSWD